MSTAFKDYVKRKFSRPAPLKGVRVLEVCTLLFGPVGYDNGYVYLKYLGYGPAKLKELQDRAVI
jgi:hypothetical protein